MAMNGEHQQPRPHLHQIKLTDEEVLILNRFRKECNFYIGIPITAALVGCAFYANKLGKIKLTPTRIIFGSLAAHFVVTSFASFLKFPQLQKKLSAIPNGTFNYWRKQKYGSLPPQEDTPQFDPFRPVDLREESGESFKGYGEDEISQDHVEGPLYSSYASGRKRVNKYGDVWEE